MGSRTEALSQAARLMDDFAARTGLHTPGPSQRYLWTDAYAVSNYLVLGGLIGDTTYAQLARRLIDQVHHVLGRFRGDDVRTGWLSGLTDVEAQEHPTRGGLRIGKKLPERPLSAPFDDSLEWDRDGQYFHYLTRWMQALDRMARTTGEPHFNRWARELAEVAHAAFVCGERGQERVGRGRRLMWKMSTDLTRPLVPSMGQHDALDGWITYFELQSTAAALKSLRTGPNLEHAIGDFATMLHGKSWATGDPLGLGGLLEDAFRVAQLVEQGALPHAKLVQSLLDAALEGLLTFGAHDELGSAASQRLAFRELGLAIGLSAVERLDETLRHNAQAPRWDSTDLRDKLRAVSPFIALRDQIMTFWLVPAHREHRSWRDHQDINDVMLAACLLSTTQAQVELEDARSPTHLGS